MLVTGVVWSVLPVKICCGYKTNVNIMMRKRTLNSTKQYKTFYQGTCFSPRTRAYICEFLQSSQTIKGTIFLSLSHHWRTSLAWGAYPYVRITYSTLQLARQWRGAHTLMSVQRIVLCSWHISGVGRIPLCQDNV